MKTKMYKFLAIAKQLMFAVMLLFVLVFGWKQSQAGPRVQSGPTLNVSPGSGLAGSTVTLTGSGYIPGGYDGTLRWDGADRAIFPIPDGGSFSISFTIPASASLGVHTITACSGSPCFTGEFEQLASASFEVTPQVPAIEADVFYGTEGQVPIQIALDEIGVLAQEGISTQEIQNVLGQKYGLQLGDEYPRGILRFKLANAQPRDDLVNLTRTILANDNSLVAQAGLVLPPLGLEPVAITSDQFIVQFNPGVSQADIDTLNADNGVAIMMPNPYMQNEFLLKVTNASDVDGLKMANRYHENSLTDYAHPNFIVPLALRETIPDDPLFANQWHHQNSGASGGTVDADVDTPLAWDITLGRNTTVIAVIDDGFDMGHPDLTPNYDTGGWDFTGCDSAAATLGCGDSDPSPGDGEDHGTAVAGVAAARGGNGIGVSGSCPNCRLMPLRRGNSRWADALAFDYARTSGAHIITNSWGYALDTVAGVPNVIRAINRAANAGRGGLGSVIFFAMSNANWDDCIGGTPDISSRQNVIAISASSNFDRKVRESAFGNCMDLLAPTHRGYNPPFAGTLNIVTTDRQGDAGYNNSNPLSGCPSTEPGPPPANARDYTFCFRGTSSATPLVAGVAGLILSAEPDLTRLQVQRVLQDTTDKIEPGTAVYSDTTGFSSPPTGQASHGYGRVNAFEAVRVVAPVANDGKGGVDIFMRDNRLDWGNTTGYLGEQPSSVLFEPTRGFIPWYESVDIKVDSPAWGYQPAPVTSADFDAFEDEAAMSGEMNRVYVRVRNRGPAAASAVQVKLHWVFAGTGLPRLPSDFWTRFPNNSADTSRVHPLGVRNITNLTNSGSSRAGRPGDTAQIVQFDFRGPDVDPGQPNPNHFCLFAVIDSPQDPIDLMSKASLIIDHIVPNDNNITLRNIGVIDTSLTRNFEQIYFVRNPTDVPLDVVLRLRNADILQQGWTIGLDNVNFNQPFSLQPDEERLVTMKVTAPELGATGEVSIIQEQAGSDPLIIMGGMTYRFAPRTATSPSLNVTPISGLTETVVTLTGIGYQPGGYVGAVRWDEADIDTLFIADGGVFTKTFTIPADASAGPHTITVCAGNPCYSGEFEQTASFTFIVTDPHAGMKTTLWHAWQGDDKTLLEQLAADFQGGDVQLVSFDTKAALLEALSDAANSTNPDLILGPDMWSDELTSLGLAEAYCLPGQCPQCEGPNPPPWCTYGKGDFSYSRNNDFLIAGLCEPDQCPVCYEPNPPRWCWAAQLDPVTAPDIFQTGFADLFNNEILPFGIPISWEAILVLANPAWFVEHEQSLPNDVDEIIQLHDIYPDLVYVDPSLIGPQAEPPANAIGKLLDALNGSPNPDPAKGGLYVVQLDQFPKFWADTGPLFLFPLTDYQPELMVQGVYVNPLAEQKEPALNFVHLLANEETQIKRFQTSGHLPAHGQAWEPMANETLVQFGQQNLLAFIGSLPAIDIPQIIDRPAITPPAFDNDACGVAAGELYERLLPPNGASDTDRVQAEFEARQFAESCRRYLPNFGSDACAQRAELNFARIFAQKRGHYYAAGLAKTAAEVGLPLCRQGPAPKLIDPASGGTLSGWISGLSPALSFSTGGVPEPVELLLSEGADGLPPDTSGILGPIFSVNAFRSSDQGLVKTFPKTFSLSVGYDDNMLGGMDESKLALFYWDVVTETWVGVPGSVDPDKNLITAELDHLTTFAVREQSDGRVYLPLIVK